MRYPPTHCLAGSPKDPAGTHTNVSTDDPTPSARCEDTPECVAPQLSFPPPQPKDSRVMITHPCPPQPPPDNISNTAGLVEHTPHPCPNLLMPDDSQAITGAYMDLMKDEVAGAMDWLAADHIPLMLQGQPIQQDDAPPPSAPHQSPERAQAYTGRPVVGSPEVSLSAQIYAHRNPFPKTNLMLYMGGFTTSSLYPSHLYHMVLVG